LAPVTTQTWPLIGPSDGGMRYLRSCSRRRPVPAGLRLRRTGSAPPGGRIWVLVAVNLLKGSDVLRAEAYGGA
jgi:hypothetical protein